MKTNLRLNVFRILRNSQCGKLKRGAYKHFFKQFELRNYV